MDDNESNLLNDLLRSSYKVFIKSPAGMDLLSHLDKMQASSEAKADAALTSDAELKHLHNAQAYKTIRAYLVGMTSEPNEN